MKKQTYYHGVPDQFIARFGQGVTGAISGFDRLRFMGTLRTLQTGRGMMGFLAKTGVLLKEFAKYVESLTGRVREHGQRMAKDAGFEVCYLRGSTQRKEELAQGAAEKSGVQEGLVAIYSCVEPCWTFFLRKDAQRKHLVLEAGQGKCLHQYYYFLHEECGLIHFRLQTWFPFTVTLCINGRQWLARQMDRAGIGYVQKRNCFTHIEALAKAQRLADLQLKTNWPKFLNQFLNLCHPFHVELCAPIRQQYYWSLKESEYATDVLFRSPRELAALYPRFLRHGIEHFGSRDVLRFLGKSVPAHRSHHGNFAEELNTSLKERPEGVRLKHYAAGNTVKLYDKEGSVLRVETTINRPHEFRVYRRREKHPEKEPQWLPMRKGIADVHRRMEVSLAANTRYLEAMAATSTEKTVGEVSDSIFKRTKKKGRPYRALNPWSRDDAALLEAVSSGDWIINGFRNADLRERLFGFVAKADRKRLASRTTRLLALLRAHSIIKKVTGSNRYLITDHGRQIVTALQTARRTSIDLLSKLAA